MDASFGATSLAMSRAVRLMETGRINIESVISHRFPLTEIQEAVRAMGTPDRNKIIIHRQLAAAFC